MDVRNYLWGAVLLLTCGVALYLLVPAYSDFRRTRGDVSELKQSLALQEHEIQRLKREIRALRTDYRAIERVAREKFRLCKDGEKIYRFDDAELPADSTSTRGRADGR